MGDSLLRYAFYVIMTLHPILNTNCVFRSTFFVGNIRFRQALRAF
jgi:hypothetical protein